MRFKFKRNEDLWYNYGNKTWHCTYRSTLCNLDYMPSDQYIVHLGNGSLAVLYSYELFESHELATIDLEISRKKLIKIKNKRVNELIKDIYELSHYTNL